MSIETKEMLYEGKAKKVFTTTDPDKLVVRYKDDATAFNGEKKGTIAGKGVINNKMSNILFKYLEENGVSTHFIEEIDEVSALVKKVEIVLIEVVIRNIAAGGIVKRLGFKEGTKLPTILEYSYKNDELGDPLINTSHVKALGLANDDELAIINKTALKVNELLQKYFAERGITLVDFKLEFGRSKDGIILADEISPDTCRLWDTETGKKLDKDRFRFELGGVEDAYKEVFAKIQ